MIVLILSSIGGVIALISAIVYVGRSIFKQVDSTDRNTQAINELTTQVAGIVDKLTTLDTRVAILEDRTKRQ